MEHEIAIVDSAGSISLPAVTKEIYGLHPGSRVTVSNEEGRIILQPLLANSLDELHGIFSSTPGLIEELQNERRQDKW